MGGLFKKPKKSKTAQYIERPGVALERDLPAYTRAAQKATAARLAEIERVMPGATAQRKQASDVISSWMRGELPKDVQEQTMRNIAEFGGAGFNPATAGRAGGFQMAQGMVPRQFGLQSQQIQEKGLSTSMGWQQLADSFAYDPFETAGYVSPSQAYGQQKASQEAYDAKVYAANQAAATNKIIGAVGTAAAIGGAFFTGGATLSLLPTTLGMMGGGAAAGGGGGGASAIGSAAGSMIGGLGGGGLNSAGFYGSQMQAANAYNVAPSALSYQSPTGLGGMLGIGKQGGYYYAPSGPFGR